MSTAPDSNTGTVPGAVAIWAEYAKDRYDAAERRLADFRGWARQLAGVVGVIVGLEAALLGQVIKLEVDARLLGGCLALLLVTVAWQLVIMGRAVAVGYVGKELLAPESPAVLADHLGGKDDAAALRMVAAYYAKGSDNVHALAEELSREMKGIVRDFKWSLWLLFIAMALTAVSAVSSHLRKTMTDTPASGPRPSEPASAAPAAAVPAEQSPAPAATPQPVEPTPAHAPSPLLVTPTPGATETHGVHAPQNQALLSTPTQGQRLTEGIEYRKK